MSGACVDNQAKCVGCEDCVNGACVDNQAKCVGCEDCVDGACADSDEKCPPGKKCVDSACVKNTTGIPTVSQWGVAVLTLLLLVGGKIYFGRRLAATDQRRS